MPLFPGSGLSVEGALIDANDTNEYTVYLNEGHRYEIILQGEDTQTAAYIADPKLFLQGQGLNLSDDNSASGHEAYLDVTATVSGAYKITVDGVGADTGKYLLLLKDVSVEHDLADDIAGAGYLAVNDTLVSDISSSGNDRDVVAVNLVAGMQYSIDLRGAETGDGTLANGVLYLEGADGQLLQWDLSATGNAHLTYTPAATGIYHVVARGAGADAGTYELQVSDGTDIDYVHGLGTGATLPMDGAIEGRLQSAADADSYGVWLVEGATYRFDLTTDLPQLLLTNPSLVLEGPNTLTVATNDNADGSTLNAQIVHTATESGYYRVIASNVAPLGTAMSFKLSAEQLSEPTPSPLYDLASSHDGSDYEVILGGNHGCHLVGGIGNEMLAGGEGKDLLEGGAGSDLLVGYGGSDTLVGGAGDDHYTLYDGGDVVSEAVGGGVDMVTSAVWDPLESTCRHASLSIL